MKRLLATISLVAVSTAGASAAAPAPRATAAAHTPAAHPAAPAHRKIAPADEYFGRLKISILGIANTIRDQGLRFDAHPDQLAAAMGSVGTAEDAIRDWEHKYPGDPWLPKTLLSLERFYLHVGDGGRARAEATTTWLVHAYAKTSYAALGRRELADAKTPPATPAATADTGNAAAAAVNAPAAAAVATPVPLNPAAPPPPR